VNERPDPQPRTLRRRIGVSATVVGCVLAVLVAVTVLATIERVRAGHRTDAIIYAIAVSLTLVLLVLVAGTMWRGLHRWVLDPVERLAAQTRLVARGDTYRQIEPDGPPELIALGRDVEAMRLQIAGQLARAEEIHEQLRQRTAELTRSNDDLQQFAYVASHDLSEPLRKVANFCQLLERQYRDQLDDRAKQYIDFAVDGAKRMQALITDLLALSRVGRTTDEFVPVSLDAALDRALENLSDRVESSGAQVERLTALPTVNGDRELLTSLLENLVSNAVKYRREDVAPVIRISAAHDPDHHRWTVTVADNGIGIDPQYAEKIFAIFQRLHLRDSYGGTGIGLALCRKIVEFHGGHIWLEDVGSEAGATFRFALPEGGTLAESRD
jgi:light-regulated signal transduction histidine kinase (bacteriophytochrome)